MRGPGMIPRCDGLAQIFIFGRARALDGGEAGVEREDGVIRRVQHRANGRLVFSGEAAVIEVPEDVRVRVNPAWSDGQPCEVVDDRACGRLTADTRDFSALDNDDCIAEDLAPAVKNGGSLQNNGAFLTHQSPRCKQYYYERRGTDESQDSGHFGSLAPSRRTSYILSGRLCFQLSCFSTIGEGFGSRIVPGEIPDQRCVCSVLEGMHVDGEPFPDLTNSKFSLGDRFGDELVRRDGLQLEIVPVDAEKSIGRGQADSFVAIEKSMIARERFHQSSGFVNEVVVVSVLWTKDGGFEKSLVTKTVDAAKFVDELAMHFDGFAHGQIDIARRWIGCGSHADYFARS